MRGDPDPAVQALAQSNASHGRPVYCWGASHRRKYRPRAGIVSQKLLADTGVTGIKIRLWETPNAWVEWIAEH